MAQLFVSRPISILALAAVAAPALKGEQPYYPTTVGAKAVYLVEGRDVTVVVKAVEVKDDSTIVTTVRASADGGPEEPGETVSVSSRGVALLRRAAFVLDQPAVMLKLPARPGATWPVRYTAMSAEQGVTATVDNRANVVGVEEIEVPAGRFKAVRVEFREADAPRPGAIEVHWYAPGVGLVKRRSDKPATIDVELKSFTPGTAPPVRK